MKRTSRHVAVLSALTMVAAITVPTTAVTAQETYSDVTLIPHIGIRGPNSSVTVSGASFKFDPTAQVGLALETPNAWVHGAIRGAVNYAHGVGMSIGDARPSPFSIGAEGAGMSITTATVSAVVTPTRTCFGKMCTDFIVGGGLTVYSSDISLASDDILLPIPSPQWRPTLQLGVGVRRPLPVGELRVELNDYVNAIRLPTGFAGAESGSSVFHTPVLSVGYALFKKGTK